MTMTTRGIILPTHRGHFPAVIQFLKSYHRYNVDVAPIPVHVITSDEDETYALSKLVPKGIPVAITSIRSLLADYGLPNAQAKSFSIKDFANKYSYQSIKKIVGVIVSGFEQSLVLDSECLLLRPTSLDSMFERYFSSPFLFHSPINHPFLDRINRASASVIGVADPDVLSRWFFEYQGWFFERKAVNAFRQHVECVHGQDLFDVLVATPDVFETISYNLFLYTHQKRFAAYRFLPVEEVIQASLGNRSESYLCSYTGAHGVIEHLLAGLTAENLEGLRHVVERFSLAMFRWEKSSYEHYWLVRRLLADCPTLTMLVCSENALAFNSFTFWAKLLIRRIYDIAFRRGRRS